MNRSDLVKAVTNQKVQNYSFLVFFFLIFAVFAFFAIRPNLITAFSLQRELDELRLQNDQYEDTIAEIVNYQTLLEQTREDFVLLDQAVPSSPRLYPMVDEIRMAASDSGVLLSDLSISQIQLKGTEDGAGETAAAAAEAEGDRPRQALLVEFTLEASFNEAVTFIEQVFSQRRLKTIINLGMATNQSQENALRSTYDVRIELEGYYE